MDGVCLGNNLGFEEGLAIGTPCFSSTNTNEELTCLRDPL